MYKQLQYTGPVYRPPSEAQSLLLQATIGCAHNSCTFCTMYKDIPFAVDSMEQIEENLKIAQSYNVNFERIFLVNGDAFVLPAGKLKDISVLIQKYLPSVQVISMYASIKNIQSKSDAELQELAKDYLINDLYVGVESGNNEALKILNKGYTKEECILQINRLSTAGISSMFSIMLGALGENRAMDNARDTADLINKTKPKMLWVLTMRPLAGSQLRAEVDQGQFVLADELENLYEEIELLKLIHVPLDFRGNHGLNLVPITGILPQDKSYLLNYLQKFIQEQGPENLKFIADNQSL